MVYYRSLNIKKKHKLFCWFANNQIKANRDRHNLITSSSDKVSICVENYSIKTVNKHLSSKIDSKLNFDNAIDGICKKSRAKTKYTVRATPYVDLTKWCILLNAFLLSQFNYLPLF